MCSQVGQKTAPEQLEWKKSVSYSSRAASCALCFDLFPAYNSVFAKRKELPCQGQCRRVRKKVKFTDLLKQRGFFCVGERREGRCLAVVLQQNCSCTGAVCGSGALFMRRSQRGGRGAGASAFLFQPLSGCLELARAGQGQAARARRSFSIPKRQGARGPASASSAVGRGSATACLGAFWMHRA